MADERIYEDGGCQVFPGAGMVEAGGVCLFLRGSFPRNVDNMRQSFSYLTIGWTKDPYLPI
jgi:hypothetical protein